MEISMTVEQAAINEGACFSISNRYLAVANGASVAIEFKTPINTDVHLEIYDAFIDSGLGYFELIEAPTVTTGVTTITPVNRRRKGTPPLSGSTLKSDPTAISSGTTLEAFNFGSTGGQGSIYSIGMVPEFKYVLKANTTYILRATNNSGSAQGISLFALWIEKN